MARLPALVTALTEVDGRGRATIDVIARTVREAGHISTTKRGGAASAMTVRDAVNLLIGANGADIPSAAPKAVEQFRTLLPRFPGDGGKMAPVLHALDTAPTFGDALEILIAGVPELDQLFRDYVAQAYAGQSAELQRLMATGSTASVGITVTMQRPMSASIVLWRSPGGKYEEEHRWEYIVDMKLFERQFYSDVHRNRMVRVSCDMTTLRCLSNTVLNHVPAEVST